MSKENVAREALEQLQAILAVSRAADPQVIATIMVAQAVDRLTAAVRATGELAALAVPLAKEAIAEREAEIKATGRAR